MAIQTVINVIATATIMILLLYGAKHYFSIAKRALDNGRTAREQATSALLSLSQEVKSLHNGLDQFCTTITGHVKMLSDEYVVFQQMHETLAKPVAAIEDMPKILVGLLEVIQQMTEEHYKLRTLLQREDATTTDITQQQKAGPSRLLPFDVTAVSASSDEDNSRKWEIMKIHLERGVSYAEAADLWTAENNAVTASAAALSEA